MPVGRYGFQPQLSVGPWIRQDNVLKEKELEKILKQVLHFLDEETEALGDEITPPRVVVS